MDHAASRTAEETEACFIVRDQGANACYFQSNAQRASNERLASVFCNPIQRFSKESAGRGDAMLCGIEAVICCHEGICSAAMGCTSDRSFPGGSFAYSSLGLALATA